MWSVSIAGAPSNTTRAGRHADQAVAIAARQIERMQVADHGDAEMLVDAQQRIHHDPRVARIERGDRLVGEDDVGLLHQRARDRDALLLAAGKLVGALRGERAMSNCSSADIASALSSSGQSCVSERQDGISAQAAPSAHWSARRAGRPG